jgi:uncharacterized protein with HEPN domain
MQRDPRAFLWDVQNAAESILRFTRGLDARAYSQSDVLTAAVERKFEVIGEALNQLLKLNPDLAHQIPDIRAIISFRNLLIHGYAAIEHDRVWMILQTSLPGLRARVARMLEELGQPQDDPTHS